MEKKARQVLISETKRKLDILQAFFTEGLVTGEEHADWRRQIIGLGINGPREEEEEEEVVVVAVNDTANKRPRKKARIEGFTYYKPFVKDSSSSSSAFGDGDDDDTTFSFSNPSTVSETLSSSRSNVSGEGGGERLPVRSGPSPLHMFDFRTKR